MYKATTIRLVASTTKRGLKNNLNKGDRSKTTVEYRSMLESSAEHGNNVKQRV
jgi:hypothetical protein